MAEQQQKLVELTPEQREQLPAWRDKWIDVGLATYPADRPKAKEGFEIEYKAANLPWHGVVLWVDSPQVMAVVGPVAAWFIEQVDQENIDSIAKDVKPLLAQLLQVIVLQRMAAKARNVPFNPEQALAQRPGSHLMRGAIVATLLQVLNAQISDEMLVPLFEALPPLALAG